METRSPGLAQKVIQLMEVMYSTKNMTGAVLVLAQVCREPDTTLGLKKLTVYWGSETAPRT